MGESDTLACPSRRAFLKGAGAVAGVGLFSSGLSVFNASAWLAPVSARADEAPREQVICTYHSANCGNRCAMRCTVRDGRLVLIEPNTWSGPEADHSVCCLKGISEIQRTYSPDRIQRPLRRVGPRGSDEFEEIGWDEAYQTIADAFTKANEEYGPGSILFEYGSPVEYPMPKLRAFLGACSGMVDGIDMGQGNGMDLTTGERMAGLHMHEITDWPNSNLVLLVGNNFLETQMTDADIFFRAKEAGTKFVCIDPMFTPTAQHCDAWYSIRPGTDAALYLGMAAEIIEQGYYDEQFILEHSTFPFLIDPDDGALLREKAPSEGDDAESNPFLVWDTVTKSARPANDEKVVPALEGTYTVGGKRCATVFSRFKEELAEGDTVAWAAEETDIDADVIRELARQYACDGPAFLATGFGGIDKFSNADIAGHAASILPVLTGNFGNVGGGYGCVNTHLACHGWTHGIGGWQLPEQFAETPNTVQPVLYKSVENNVHVVVCIGNNLYTAMGNWTTTTQWLDALDLVVTVDPHFNDSARYSDIILPGTGCFESREPYRGVTGTKNHMLLQRAVIEPLFESKTDYEIERDLCELLGFTEYLPESREAELRAGFAQVEGAAAMAAITLDTLVENDSIMRFDVPTDVYDKYRDLQFATDSGRLEPYHASMVAVDQELPHYIPPVEAYHDNPLAEKYPLQLGQKHGRYRAHSMFSNSTWINQIEPVGLVYVSVDDATQRGIASGDRVRVFNDRGSMEGVARVSGAVRPGSLLVNDGCWTRETGGQGMPNLINDALNERAAHLIYGGNMALNDTLVQVEKA